MWRAIIEDAIYAKDNGSIKRLASFCKHDVDLKLVYRSGGYSLAVGVMLLLSIVS